MFNLTGQVLGRYRVIQPLGEGGMAAVYKAHDDRLERYVAIKIILPGFQHSENFLTRFEREAKALARLNHTNIIPIIDFGDEKGIPYLVMPFQPGGTLKDRLGRPIPCAEAARQLLPVANALGYAHQQGIVHRDVKPANILVTAAGDLLLSDFGVAKILDTNELKHMTGSIVGTPQYMSPEQIQGKVSPQADIYALGTILYQMITGKLPHTADTPEAVIIKQVTEPLRGPRDWVPDLPDQAEQVILKALAKDPQNRYQTMEEFARGLSVLAKLGQIPVNNVSMPVKPAVGTQALGQPAPVVSPRRIPAWAWLVPAALLLAGLGIWFAPRLINSKGVAAPTVPPVKTIAAVNPPAVQNTQIVATRQAVASSTALPPTSTAAPQRTEVFRNDFESGNATGFAIVYGTAQVLVDENSNHVLQIGPSATAWPVLEFGPKLENFSIAFRFRQVSCNSSCNLNFWYRGIYRGDMTGYEILFGPVDKSISLMYQQSSTSGENLGSTPFEMINKEWYHAAVEVNADLTTMIVNGMEMLNIRTEKTYDGKLAFHVFKGSAYQIDDLIVWKLGP